VTKNEVRPNRDIENFVLSGQFEMDEMWGWDQLAQYMNDLYALSVGTPYQELGISSRRASSLPSLIVQSSSGLRFVRDANIIHRPEETPAGSFAHLRLQGVMRSQDGISSRGVGSLLSDIQAAYQNENIEGILLEVNSGGGESLSGTMLQGALADAPKPVVVYAHMMASAALRATLPVDEIVASGEGAQAGSIGTFITLDRSFAEWYKTWYEDIYADKSTNKNREFRDFLEGNRDTLRKSINRSNQVFLDEVQAYRTLRRDVEHTLSGAMFNAREAKSRGLVDSIGSLTYATQRLAAYAGRKTK
jgi:ClpP class serine protease